MEDAVGAGFIIGLVIVAAGVILIGITSGIVGSEHDAECTKGHVMYIGEKAYQCKEVKQ